MKLAVFCSLFAGKSQAEDTHALYASYRCGESLGAVRMLTSHNARHGNASHAVSVHDEMGRYSRRTSPVFGLAWGQRASMVVRGLGDSLIWREWGIANVSYRTPLCQSRVTRNGGDTGAFRPRGISQHRFFG